MPNKISKVELYRQNMAMLNKQAEFTAPHNYEQESQQKTLVELQSTQQYQPAAPQSNKADQPRFSRTITDVRSFADPNQDTRQAALDQWKAGIEQQIQMNKRRLEQEQRQEQDEESKRQIISHRNQNLTSPIPLSKPSNFGGAGVMQEHAHQKTNASFNGPYSPVPDINDVPKAYKVNATTTKIPRMYRNTVSAKPPPLKLPAIIAAPPQQIVKLTPMPPKHKNTKTSFARGTMVTEHHEVVKEVVIPKISNHTTKTREAHTPIAKNHVKPIVAIPASDQRKVAISPVPTAVHSQPQPQDAPVKVAHKTKDVHKVINQND
jgi:hypothetical protein